jgi:hypothetical protein
LKYFANLNKNKFDSSGDMFNNNTHAINVETAEEALDDDDEVFNTNFVAFTENLSKSLNDLYLDCVPQNGLRPHSLVLNTDDFSCYVSTAAPCFATAASA